MGKRKHKPADRRGGRRPAEVAEQTKTQILEESLKSFASKGYHATSLRSIATETGTTHGLIRHHFGTKEDLWIAAVSYMAQQIGERQQPVLQNVTEDNALESFETIMRILIQSAAQHPELWRVLAIEALEDSHRLDHLIAIARPLHEKITPLFEMLQRKGLFADYTEDTFFIAVVSLGAMPFALSPFTNKMCNMDITSEESAAAHADRVVDTLFAGIQR